MSRSLISDCLEEVISSYPVLHMSFGKIEQDVVASLSPA